VLPKVKLSKAREKQIVNLPVRVKIFLAMNKTSVCIVSAKHQTFQDSLLFPSAVDVFCFPFLLMKNVLSVTISLDIMTSAIVGDVTVKNIEQSGNLITAAMREKVP